MVASVKKGVYPFLALRNATTRYFNSSCVGPGGLARLELVVEVELDCFLLLEPDRLLEPDSNRLAAPNCCFWTCTEVVEGSGQGVVSINDKSLSSYKGFDEPGNTDLNVAPSNGSVLPSQKEADRP